MSSIKTAYPSFIQSVKNAKKAVKDCTTRKLTLLEIESLRANGNRSLDSSWGNVNVMNDGESFDPSIIHGCFFMENVILCAKVGTVSYKETSFPCCLSNSTFRNCVVYPSVFVHQNTLIENSLILGGSIVLGCGRITCLKNSSFGNGVAINMGNEMGGLEVKIYGDMMYNDLNGIVEHGAHNDETMLQEYLQAIQFDYSIIGPNAFVENCPLLDSMFIGESAYILASTLTNMSVISSSANQSKVMSGNAKDCILQWGCAFESGSNCNQSILCEHTETSCNAKIINSIIAPNTGVSSGECNSSLVGPFIGFHHNSVLISALWFGGKGNIGYGANIGSNHTGKLPDQECLPGEGIFFGLGCNIKYPCNLRNSPYSIVASGVTMLPQRVIMPFSLINNPMQINTSVSPALNISYKRRFDEWS